MSKRTYRISVPYTTSFKDGLAIEAGLSRPEAQEALKHLPASVVAKLHDCGPLSPQTFSKAELDSVPDPLWAKLEPHLG